MARARRTSWLAEAAKRIQDEKDAADVDIIFESEPEEDEVALTRLLSAGARGGTLLSPQTSGTDSGNASRPVSSKVGTARTRSALDSTRRIAQQRRMGATQRRNAAGAAEPVSDSLFTLRRPASATALADSLMRSAQVYIVLPPSPQPKHTHIHTRAHTHTHTHFSFLLYMYCHTHSLRDPPGLLAS